MQRGQEELASSRHDQNQSKVIAGKSSSYQANAEFQGTSWKLIYDNRALYKEDLDQRTAKNRTLQRLSRLLVAERRKMIVGKRKEKLKPGGVVFSRLGVRISADLCAERPLVRNWYYSYYDTERIWRVGAIV